MEESASTEKPAMRFLSFANDEEDAEKKAKLQEAAARIEQAVAKEKALNELIDYKEKYPEESQQIDPAKDTRSLYERLREQRDKKKEDLEEAQKLSNLITKLDEDDVDYLNEVAKNKREEELRKRLEIQDALEAKRMMDEQKMIDQERKMKESLLGKSVYSASATPGAHKSSISKLMMSSKIKVKLKPKDQDAASTDSDPGKGNQGGAQPPSSESGGQQGGNPATQTFSKGAIRDQGTGPQSDSAGRKDEGSDEESSTPTPGVQNCSCQRDVMTSIGVLPSLPIVRHFRDSSDESDNSDDDLERRLVPRSCKRRR